MSVVASEAAHLGSSKIAGTHLEHEESCDLRGGREPLYLIQLINKLMFVIFFVLANIQSSKPVILNLPNTTTL